MKQETDIYSIGITGLGMMASVGHDVKTACASIRAGLKRPATLQNFYAVSRKGYEEWEDGLVTGHPVLDGDCDNTEGRIHALLASALKDLREDAELDGSIAVPLYLALPGKERAVMPGEAVASYVAENPSRFPGIGEVIPFPMGHAGGVLALSRAISDIESGACRQAIVAGVDSLLGFGDLSRYNRANRLKTEENSDGFMPGEAAAAILVEKITSAEKRVAWVQGVVGPAATGVEENHFLSGSTAGGHGLSETVNALFPPGDASAPDIRAIITDANGEAYRFEELAFMHARVFSRMNGKKELIYPARCTGDTGAASACVAICLAVRTMGRGGFGKKSSGSDCLVLSSSDSGERGALLIKPYTSPDSGGEDGRNGRSQ